jgi:hypothetical protein
MGHGTAEKDRKGLVRSRLLTNYGEPTLIVHTQRPLYKGTLSTRVKKNNKSSYRTVYHKLAIYVTTKNGKSHTPRLM